LHSGVNNESLFAQEWIIIPWPLASLWADDAHNDLRVAASRMPGKAAKRIHRGLCKLDKGEAKVT
jgi:hypothetical protein